MTESSAYHEMFAEESAEFLTILEDGLRSLTARTDDRIAVDDVFRGVHSLKGMCAAMGYRASEELSAAMERLIGAVRDGGIEVTVPLLESMKEASSLLATVIAAEVADDAPVDVSLPDLDPVRFGAAEAGGDRPDRTRLVRVEITLDDACTLKAVRAHVVMKRIALMGEVTGSEPTPACLQEERFDRTFAVTVRTDHATEEIVAAAKGIAEVTEVSAEQLAACNGDVALPGFSEMQIDALGEVGNIGAGHAATALSEVLGKRISLSQPVLHLVSASEVPYAFGISKTLVGATYSRLVGAIGGGILSAATHDALLVLSDLVAARPVCTTRALGPAEEELFVTVGAALAEAYVGAVSLMTGLDIDLADAAFELDNAGTILSRVARDASADAPWAALVRTTLTAENQSIDVAVVFIPDQSGIAVLFDRLGLG